MKVDNVIIIFYILPLVVCTFYTVRNIWRLLNEGHRLSSSGMYTVFLLGIVPVLNMIVAWYYLSLAAVDASIELMKILEKINRNNGNKVD